MSSDTDLPHQPDTYQLKPLTLLATVILTALMAGAAGYWLGIRNTQPIHLSQPPSSQPTMTTQTSATIAESSNLWQSINRYPTPTEFNPPASWKVYKSEFRYQYAYPPTWHQYPEINAPSSSVSAPGAKYPNGYFIVEREAGGVLWCKKRRTWLLEDNPSMKQEEITISGYPAVQLEGKSRLDDGYYDRKSVLVTRGDTCYFMDITSKNNPDQLIILNQIMSTFVLSD